MRVIIYRPGYGPVETTTPVQLAKGDTLGVQFALGYSCYKEAGVVLRGFLYSEAEGTVADSGLLVFDLPAAPDGGTLTGEVQIGIGEGIWGFPPFQIPFPIPAPSPGLYTLGLFCVDDSTIFDVEADAVQIVEEPGFFDTVSSMISMMVMILMMSMIMPMVSGLNETPVEGGA